MIGEIKIEFEVVHTKVAPPFTNFVIYPLCFLRHTKTMTYCLSYLGHQIKKTQAHTTAL